MSAERDEAPMGNRLEAADYHFHVLFETSNLRVDYQGAQARMIAAARAADDDLVLIASDRRFKPA